jgi:hypothetical protein
MNRHRSLSRRHDGDGDGVGAAPDAGTAPGRTVVVTVVIGAGLEGTRYTGYIPLSSGR